MAINEELNLLNNIDKDLEWFKKNINKLKNQFDDQFVAIKNRDVIESDRNMEGIIKKLRARNEEPSKLLIKFVSTTPFIF